MKFQRSIITAAMVTALAATGIAPASAATFAKPTTCAGTAITVSGSFAGQSANTTQSSSICGKVGVLAVFVRDGVGGARTEWKYGNTTVTTSPGNVTGSGHRALGGALEVWI